MTVDKQYDPKPGSVFVFGSNLQGLHAGGAARFAYRLCGAVWEQGEGFMGNPSNGAASYAIPTKLNFSRSLSVEDIIKHVDKFIEFAWEHRELEFFVTRIGCGLAGFTDDDIAPLFEHAPPNCILPYGWEDYGDNQ